MPTTLSALADLSADHLTARVYDLRKKERHLLVEFLVHVAEIDRRRLYLTLGHSSLFAFLTDFLGYTRSAAFRRSTAARLLARFPVVADQLADGRLCLTTLVELRDVLDESRLDEILGRAAGRTEDEVKALVLALRPRPDAPDLLRRLPPRTEAPTPEPAPVPVLQPSSTPGPALPPAPGPAPRVEPLSETRHLLRMTVGADFVRDLEAVRAALSHQIPGGHLEAVLHECIRTQLASCEKRRRGTGRSTSPRPARPGSRYVPAAIRDEVWRRDTGRCAFIGSTGRRCDSTHKLELHHLVPFARGGAATVENLSLRCAEHNRHEADRDFGAEHMARALAQARAQTAFW